MTAQYIETPAIANIENNNSPLIISPVLRLPNSRPDGSAAGGGNI